MWKSVTEAFHNWEGRTRVSDWRSTEENKDHGREEVFVKRTPEKFLRIDERHQSADTGSIMRIN